jgi:hypothetical protein
LVSVPIESDTGPVSPPTSFGATDASRFARLALSCIHREYPNKLDHVLNGSSEVRSPRELHPAFYGCFDWHSAVHGHWMLVRLLKLFPALAEAAEIRRRVEENIAVENIAGELAYLAQPSRDGFERTYGWAWLLKLAEELGSWDDSDGRRWSQALEPLARAFAGRFVGFLPKLTYPIRSGTHANTAFGLAFAWDYAEASGHAELRRVVAAGSLRFFGRDTDAPLEWEPSGEDFFSPCLMEADLMRRVMASGAFRAWFHTFLPDMVHGRPAAITTPARVSDRTDGRLVHLDGLNLSRAWCMRGIAEALPAGDAARDALRTAAAVHTAASCHER